MRVHLYLLSVLLSYVVGSNNLYADLSYTNQTDFLTALSGGSTTFDFDSIPHNTILTTQFSGVNFNGSATIYNERDFPSGGSFQSPPNVLLNTTPPDPITFRFDTTVSGVGFFNVSIADRLRLTLFGTAGETLFVGELPEASVNFLGFISDRPILSGSVVGIAPQTFGTIFIDDFSFGIVAVPEPSSLAMILVCGVLVRFRLRNRSDSED